MQVELQRWGVRERVHGQDRGHLHCVRGVPALGVVYDPYRDELFVGLAAEAAFCNGALMQSDGCTDLRLRYACADHFQQLLHTGTRRLRLSCGTLRARNTRAALRA